jgi:alpha-tubulin suppressor-like RCC1 family protein
MSRKLGLLVATIAALSACSSVGGSGSSTEAGGPDATSPSYEGGPEADGTTGGETEGGADAAADGSTDAPATVDATDAPSALDAPVDGLLEDAGSEVGSPDAALDGSPDASPDGSPCPGTKLFCNNVCVPNDEANCGSCGNDCTTKHVTSSVACVNGECSFPSIACATGYQHCSSDAGDGCETDITQASNCGSCGHSCGSLPICAPGGACTKAVAIAAANEATFAVMANGMIASWGLNTSDNAPAGSSGLLGTGDATLTQANTPVYVTGIANAVGITAGDAHACALLSDGTVKCWGDNAFGQLGKDYTAVHSSATPLAVAGLSGVTALAAGYDHTCALVSGGAVKCWGFNAYYELGNTSTATCEGDAGTTPCSSAPSTVSGMAPATALAAGPDTTCAIVPDGGVDCWGANINGELGNGSTTGSPHYAVAAPGPVLNIGSAVALGGFNTGMCAILADGTGRCWGDDGVDQLGDGNGGFGNFSATPVTVLNVTGAVSLAPDPMGAAACAVLSNGKGMCWGYGPAGQLGDGTQSFPGPMSAAPAQIVSLTNIASIAAGDYHACALLTTGDVWCWGADGQGQLGNPAADPNMNSTPMAVAW